MCKIGFHRLTYNAKEVTTKKMEVYSMGKTETLNIRVNPDVKGNADMMSVTQIHQKLEKGYADIEKGNVEDAASAFVAFKSRH